MGYFGEELVNQGVSSLKNLASDLMDTDPTLGTCSPAEAHIRNTLSFATLRFKFPTTATNTTLSFPAYLTAFSDSFTPQWSATPVFGRADAIPIYKNTDRAISLAFAIPNYDRDDANENLKKLNMVVKSLYPGYTNVGDAGAQQTVLASPPLVRIKFANFLVNHANPNKGLLGYITSFSSDFGINQRGVFTDGSAIPGKQALLPRVLTFNISFKPLHESVVGWDVNVDGGQFFGNRDFPYRTRASLGDVMQAGMSAIGGGTGEQVQFSEILGSTG